MRLEAPPSVACQQLFTHSHLFGAGKLVGNVPRCIAPAPPVGRRTERLGLGIDLPDAIGAVGVARRAAQHAGPKHEALDLLPACFQDTLITNLAYEHGHARSEEHTSELQSRLHLVCRLLLEKKKKPP